ncbi:Deoxyribose-phosphate aldolase [compost metagenome]
MIIESGELGDPELIRTASRETIEGGADFIKTSTGKVPVNATPEAAQVMLECIAEAGGKVGFKASGGLRTLEDARVYLEMAERLLGAEWTSPQHLRFGASALLDDLLRRLKAIPADIIA